VLGFKIIAYKCQVNNVDDVIAAEQTANKLGLSATRLGTQTRLGRAGEMNETVSSDSETRKSCFVCFAISVMILDLEERQLMLHPLSLSLSLPLSLSHGVSKSRHRVGVQ